MSSNVVPAVMIGGVAYVLAKQSSPTVQPGGPTNYQAPSAGSTIAQASAGVPSASVFTPVGTSSISFRSRLATVAFGPSVRANYIQTTVDPELQKKLDELEKYAQQQYENANAVAKAAAADKLNKELKLDPPLTGHEDWKTVASVVGGATGAAAGAALCGPVCGKVGALVGAYLGVQIEEAIAKNWNEMISWCKSKWGDLKDAIEDAAGEVKDAVGDALDWINPF